MEVKKQEEMQERLEKFYRETLQIKEDGLVQAAVPASRILTLRVGEILIREGTVPTNLCFLLKGVIRGVLPNHNGKDVTDCISCRYGDSVMPDSDYTRPASVTMEVLEDSEVLTVPLETVQKLMDQYPRLVEVYRDLVLRSAVMHRELKIAVYQYDALQRYQWFLRTYPGLIDRIPHKYTASFLNMTPVTLSNVRKAVREKQHKENW